MSEWQPIETAPIDGTHVLIYGTYQWEDYADEMATGVVVGFFDAASPEFRYMGANRWKLVNANPYVDYADPTHCMPLPPSPLDGINPEA